MKKHLIILLFLFTALCSYGQKPSLHDISKVESPKGFAEWWEHYIFGNSDSAYIALPKERFMISANLLLSGIYNKTINRIPILDVDVDYVANSGLCSKWSIGAAFRNLKVNYSRNISGTYGRDFSIGLYGKIVGGEVQWQSYENVATTMHAIIAGHNLTIDFDENSNLNNVKVDRFLVNLYYVANHKKFSYNSAFAQAFIQKKSCGSFIAGLTYIYNEIMADNLVIDAIYGGATPIYTTHDIAIGAGYAYNFVSSNRHFMAHISAMPLLKYTIKAKIKRENAIDESSHYVEILNDEIDAFNNKHFNLRPSCIGRVALLYTVGRYVTGVQGVYNYFWSGDDKGLAISTNTWQARAYFGVRF